jgi:photosystem II stability/assembly factor-like uncharacterized protein
MKTKLISIVLLNFLVSFALHSEWQNVKILENSAVISSSFILQDNSIVVLSDRNKIFKSDSQQENWNCIFENPNNQATAYFSKLDSQNIVFSAFALQGIESFIYNLNCETDENTIIRDCTPTEELLEMIRYQNLISNSNKIYAFGGIIDISYAAFPIISFAEKDSSTWTDLYLDDFPNEMAVIGSLIDGNIISVLANGNSGAGARIVKSNDNGETWEEKYYNSSYSGGFVLEFFDDSTGILTGNNGFLLKTEDGGETWFDIFSAESFENKNYSFVDVHFFSKDTMFLVGINGNTGEGIICYSENGGSDWEIVHRLAGSTLLSISVKDDDIYCFGRNGMMVKGKIDDLTSIEENNLISNINISPNPAIEKLTIKNENIINEIEIFDISGKLLNVYHNIEDTKAELNISHLLSGTYFLKVDGKVIKFVKE